MQTINLKLTVPDFYQFSDLKTMIEQGCIHSKAIKNRHAEFVRTADMEITEYNENKYEITLEEKTIQPMYRR